jgi:RNA polymerase-binding transcription factor DksA
MAQIASTSSPFTPAELAVWRQRLIDQARSLSADVAALDDETVLRERVGTNYHLSEGAAELQVVGNDAAAASEEQEVLRLVMRALRKIEAADPCAFGICEITGTTIESERLELMPWTPFSAAGVAMAEIGGLGVDDASPMPKPESWRHR